MFYGSCLSFFLSRVRWRDKSRKRSPFLPYSILTDICFLVFLFSYFSKQIDFVLFVISLFSATRLTPQKSSQDVCCYAIRHGGPERGLQAPSGSTGRLCLQVLPAPFHQGKSHTYRIVWHLEQSLNVNFSRPTTWWSTSAVTATTSPTPAKCAERPSSARTTWNNTGDYFSF